MAGAYGWSDDGRHEAWAELYRLPAVLADAGLRHIVVRDAGQPVACASLFTSAGHAFVTNVGTRIGDREPDGVPHGPQRVREDRVQGGCAAAAADLAGLTPKRARRL